MTDTGLPSEHLPDDYQDDWTDTAQTARADAGGAATALQLQWPYEAASERLDKALARLLPAHSRSRLQGWIEAGHVLLNNAPGTVRQRVRPGDRLLVYEQPAPEALAFTAQDVAFEVVAGSDDWLVIHKPAGLVTHPGAGNWSGTLLNGLLFRYPELRHVARAGIVHRLDKDTSGLLVVARHERAQTALVRQLQARSVTREYIALVHGSLAESGRIERAIGRDAGMPVRMSVDRPIAPKPAVTHYTVHLTGRLDSEPVTAVRCRLETGRTHQIRVHMASLGHPLVADRLYGGRPLGNAQRQMLHARVLAFDDPCVPEPAPRIRHEAPLPADMMAVWETLGWAL